MGFGDVVAMAIAFGCPTLVVLYIVNATLGSKRKVLQAELRQALERGEVQEQRIRDLARQNEQLHEQVEWHLRLLHAQERALGEPASDDRNGRVLAGHGHGRR